MISLLIINNLEFLKEKIRKPFSILVGGSALINLEVNLQGEAVMKKKRFMFGSYTTIIVF